MTATQGERYKRERKLGAGAMGEVWLATDTLLKRPVAIKYLQAIQDPHRRELFQSEAQTLASLNHPNITLIYDAVLDEDKNQYHLMMEYVEGMSLADVIHRWKGPLPLEVILDVTIGILEALQYAHDKDVVHRDIKPENVIMQKEGVKLTDFGVAGLISLLSEGAEYIVGTPAYIAPEQVESGIVDGRADLYALGVMLFEMVSGGQLPFTGQNQDELFDAHIEQPPPSIRQLAPDIPVALEHTIMQLLSKDPDDRYPEANAVIDILETIQARLKLNQPHLQLLETEAHPLIGRTSERQQMQHLWETCREHAQAHLLVIQGEAGSGKSRLVTEFLSHNVVDQGFVAVVGRCGEAGIPYAPFTEILSTILNKQLASTPLQSQIEHLLDQMPGLARMLDLPEKASAPSELVSPKEVRSSSTSGLWQTLSSKMTEEHIPDDHSAQTEWQFFAIVLNLLTEASPLAICLEDAIFLDEASINLIRFLVRQSHTSLLIIVTYRKDSTTIPWLAELPQEKKSIISLKPLDTLAIEEYLTTLLESPVSEALVQTIEEQSQGNPLRIEETTQHLLQIKEIRKDEKTQQWAYHPSQPDQITGGFLPKAVLSAFTRRINRLSSDSREALAIAALIENGPEFNFDTWVTVLGGEEKRETAQNVLQEALKKRLLRSVSKKRYAFRPAEVAQTLLAHLTGTQRREIHDQIAQVLHQEGADPILVTEHMEKGGQTEKAVPYLINAGTRAMSMNAIETAIAYYTRANELKESLSSYITLGHLYRRQGKPTRAIQIFRQGLALAKQKEDYTRQAQILNGLAYTLWRHDHYKEACQTAKAVLKLPEVTVSDQAIAQSHLAMGYWLLGEFKKAAQWSQKAHENLHQSEDESTLATISYRTSLIIFSQGKLAKAKNILQETRTLRHKLKDKNGEAYSLIHLGKIETEQGHFEAAAKFFEQAQQLFEESHNRHGQKVVYTYQGQALLYQNQPHEALSYLTTALNITLELSRRNTYSLSNIYLLIAQASLKELKVDLAHFAAEDGLKLAQKIRNREYMAKAQAILASIYDAQGKIDQAQETYQKALTDFKNLGHPIGLTRTRWQFAQFLKNQGQTEKASREEQTARQEAEQMGLYLDESR